jgi:hypothetical protein
MVMVTVPWNPAQYKAFKLSETHYHHAVMNIRVTCRDMEIFGVNTPCLPRRACAHGVQEGLRCMPWPKCSSTGVTQLTDGTWHLGEDAWRPPSPAPTRLALAACCLRTRPRWRAGARHRGACVSPGISPGQGPGVGRYYGTRGGPGRCPGRGAGPGVVRHMAASNLALVKRATPVVVDLVLVLGLSRYLGVPLPRGTNKHLDFRNWKKLDCLKTLQFLKTCLLKLTGSNQGIKCRYDTIKSVIISIFRGIVGEVERN